MARNVNARLEQLRTRRAGTDRLDRLNETAAMDAVLKSYTPENWQKRAKNQPNTRYALGSMQAVDPDYTAISLEEAQRVGKQLETRLAAEGIVVGFELQGSVPLDIHIRGVSDVDLLTLEGSIFVYDSHGCKGRAGYYVSAAPRTTLGALQTLRSKSETALKTAYPAANVDTSGGKAISLSGGSLRRPVDVVPSVWWDTADYQASSAQHDRGVTILNKKVPETISNLPFLHIKRVTDRCMLTGGGLRKAIRLAKNVRADAEKEGTAVELPSFDIAAAMWHADQSALRAGLLHELAILAEAQRHFDFLARNNAYAQTLQTPCGSRRIFDNEAKLRGLMALSLELDDLAREVAKEHNPQLVYAAPTLDESRRTIEGVFVPAAA